MKILWQAFDTVGYTGGPVVNALRLLPEFVKRGHKVVAIFEFLNEHPNVDKLRELGVECVTFSPPAYSEDHVRVFLNEILRFKPDVFVSNISVYAGLAGHWAIKWGIPVIHTHRSDDELNNGMAQLFFASERKWRLSALVCVNRYLLAKVQALTPDPIKHKVIPSGVPLSAYQAEQRAGGKFRVVYAGRLVEKQKRISDVVMAFIALARLDGEIEFSIIGHGKDELVEQLKETVEIEGLANRIHFTGRLHGNDYKKALAAHHVIVLLSDYEGIPGSLMDGMSCGLVPVVHEMNGIEELVDHNVNGMIVKNRSTDFVEAILRLKRDVRRRQELSFAALQTITSRFSLEHAANEWEALFQELVRESEPGQSFPRESPRRIRLFRAHAFIGELKLKPDLKTRLMFKFRKLAQAVQNLKL